MICYSINIFMLNFKEWLELQESTVSQSLKDRNQWFNNPAFGPGFLSKILDIFKLSIIKKPWAANVSSDLIDALSKWLLYVALLKTQKDLQEYIGQTLSPDAVTKKLISFVNNPLYSGILPGTWDYFTYMLQNSPQLIKSKFNNSTYTIQVANEEQKKWHEDIANSKRPLGSQGRVVETPDMPAGYKWVSLDRASCDVEANAMGHCGNSTYSEGDNIYSLRDSKNKVYLTFVVNNGVLGESKGYGNEKPSKKYHPQIVSLLLGQDQGKPIVNYIKGGGHEPENNFQLTDLDKNNLEKVLKAKPYLNRFFDYLAYKHQGNNADYKKELDQNYNYDFKSVDLQSGNVIIDQFSNFYDLIKWLDEYTKSDVLTVNDINDNIENFYQYEDVSPSVASDAFYSYANKENKAKMDSILEKLNSKLGEEEYEEDLDYWIEKDKDILEILREAYNFALQEGMINATLESAMRKFSNVMADEGEGYIKYDKEKGWTLMLSFNALEKLKDQIENDMNKTHFYHPINQSFIFNYDTPREPSYGFDKKYYNKTLSDRLKDLI